MKKKVLATLLTGVMATTLLAGCGNAAAPAAEAPAAEAPATEEAAPAAESEAAEAPAAELPEDTGKVLNISAWNEEFKSRLEDHYPGYEKIDGTTGKIGDVTVNWLITPNEENAYQNRLDEILLAQDSAAADDKLDLFLVEADYAVKYTDTDYTMALTDLGISADEMKDQYTYTQDVVTDSNGVVKGTSWQGCPGVMIYNREIAKEVFGSDDPATIQPLFSDWDKFYESAGKLDEAGYDVISSTADTFRVYQNNAKLPWVDGNKIQVDDNLIKWVEDSKKLADAGYCNTWGQWGEDWNKGFYPEGKVFAYFGPAWLIDFCMAADTEGSVAHDGGWAATEGPQGFYWGGTWICAATGTDNANLVADIMRKMTMDPEIMKDIVLKDNDFVNNRPVMEGLAADESYSNAVLGGQNPLKMFCAGADKIDMANLTAYDQGLLGDFQTAMGDYINGNYATIDEAMDQFYTLALQRYPELTK
ncbi:MAG: carbohydrate ABC transporter substrate-binding protein [Lachnospiraceae bacterium]|nr:carbohydrate ABC transporter substrate-binding protein [Lachnospiraceae bacterium]